MDWECQQRLRQHPVVINAENISYNNVTIPTKCMENSIYRDVTFAVSKTLWIGHRGFGILFFGAAKQNWSTLDRWISSISGGEEWNNSEAWWWLSDALGMFSFLWHWKPAVESKVDSVRLQEILQENIMYVWGRPFCSTVIPSMPQSPPSHGFKWLPQSPDLNSIDSLYWDLKVVAAQKPKNSKLEAIAEGKWAKISQEHF